MNYETLRIEMETAVAIVSIDRPEKRNALNQQVRSELIDAINELTRDETVRVIVVTGSGERAFVAGADIDEFAARTPLEQRAAMQPPRVFEAITTCPKPVIAMIQGFALGGGCELAMACDLRIASETARLGQPEINLGLIPGGGGTQRLPRLVGIGQAMRLILSGEIIDAAEALRIGLVDQVVPAERLRETVLELAMRIASKSPVAIANAKAAIRAASEMPLAGGLQYESELFVTSFSSDDASEGIRAFQEKRPPRFQGR